jgi:hypothetical protein
MRVADGPGLLVLLIPLTAIVVPTVLGFRHAARKRDLEHRERMKALEMGMPLPGDSAWTSALCICIGAVVPVASLVVGLIATLVAPGGRRMSEHPGDLSNIVFWDHVQSSNYYTTIWTGVGFVGVAGVVGGTLLAMRLLGSRDRSRIELPATGKPPAFDPDAYDTVGRRG